ncbi:unnamed protein product [Oppiella nova]|uniref:Cation/H+ exchanger transmembrane domain-containing protein n=1 Tax=Oppiella nova TaxID=334625 RepID=A0A7R9M4I7_9ACAR|nr:unnamed protein product [Oppiella nova]CAG2170379.1 unnamed protein product [Oppiella nova]
MWSIIGEEALPPDGSLFNVLLVFVLAYICGQLVSIIRLPPLLGMLAIGFTFGNVMDLNLNQSLSATLRSIALVIILLRAGLGLDPQVIKKLSGVCLRLSLIPCTVEAFTFAATSYLLIDLPFNWGVLLGFILSGVSSAIVIPNMIALQERCEGTDKGIPTLLMASASVDNVMAITGFGVCVGLVFDTGSSIVWSVFKGPVSVLIGVVIGTTFGLILWYIPDKYDSYKTSPDDSKLLRLSLLILFGMFLVFVSKSVGFDGTGPLGCLILAFITSLKWRGTPFYNPIREDLKFLWTIFEAFLFVLIGTEVKISDLQANSIGLAIVCLLIALFMRFIVSSIVVFGVQLNLKEKIFIAISWIPKATVQAAIGPIALDLARDRNDPQLQELAKFVLTIAVISIIITAPLGAIAMSLTANKCLKTEVRSQYEDLEDNCVIRQTMEERTEVRPLLNDTSNCIQTRSLKPS